MDLTDHMSGLNLFCGVDPTLGNQFKMCTAIGS